jgi:hypothetical protein
MAPLSKTSRSAWALPGRATAGRPLPASSRKKGALYGTTENGGFFDKTSECAGYGCGVVFKLDGTAALPQGGGDETAAQ